MPGLAMQEELEALDKALGNPAHPVVAIVGGAKISSKLELLANLIRKVDALVIGGGMANTFLAAKGVAIGKSLNEPDLEKTAKQIMLSAADTRLRHRAADRRRGRRRRSRRTRRMRRSSVDAVPADR